MPVLPVKTDSGDIQIHRARWVVKDSDTVIENGYVSTFNARIVDYGRWGETKPDGRVTDYGEGVLVPSFINAHTHLELSALKNRLVFDKGFKQWVKDLIVLRDSATNDTLEKGLQQGINELLESGCSVVGEIATLGTYEHLFLQSRLDGVYFREYLGGSRDDLVDCINSVDLKRSLAGHAPHTTSPEMIQKLKSGCLSSRMPFSIHVSESEDEYEFVRTGKGSWADYLKERGIDFSNWPVTPQGSVAYLDGLNVLDNSTIAVHLRMTEKPDLKILQRTGVHVCLCLRSNVNLHYGLPDVTEMHQAGVPLCLGTDSLASTGSLSLLDEMAFLYEQFPEIPPHDVYKMATINGAKALGMADMYGSIDIGKSDNIFYLSGEIINKSGIISSLLGV